MFEVSYLIAGREILNRKQLAAALGAITGGLKQENISLETGMPVYYQDLIGKEVNDLADSGVEAIHALGQGLEALPEDLRSASTHRLGALHIDRNRIFWSFDGPNTTNFIQGGRIALLRILNQVTGRPRHVGPTRFTHFPVATVHYSGSDKGHDYASLKRTLEERRLAYVAEHGPLDLHLGQLVVGAVVTDNDGARSFLHYPEPKQPN